MAFLIKYQVIKGFYECDQEIKVKFRRSKILIPVADGSTVLTTVTTPQGVVTLIRPVEPSATGIKMESSDQEAI